MPGTIVPLILALLMVFCTWLGIAGPLPIGAAEWLHKWQTLIAATLAATIASTAAYIAFWNTSRTIEKNDLLESRRRKMKHEAGRAVLPLSLAEINRYAQASVAFLKSVIPQIPVGATIPFGILTTDQLQNVPGETTKALADFIEYADNVNTTIVSNMLAYVQIHDARLRGYVRANNTRNSTILLWRNIEDSIIDAACIFAAASALYEYARRRTTSLPDSLDWEAVRSALRQMDVWDMYFPNIFALVDFKQSIYPQGPFQQLQAN